MSITIGAEIMAFVCLIVITVIFSLSKKLHNITTTYFQIMFAMSYLNLISQIILTWMADFDLILPKILVIIVCIFRGCCAILLMGMLAEYTYVTTFGYTGYTEHKYFIMIGMPALLLVLGILGFAVTGNLCFFENGLFTGIHRIAYWMILTGYLIYGAIIFFIMNRNRGLVSKKINRWLQLAAMVECIAIFLCGYFGYLVESILMPFVLVYIYLIVHYPKNFVDFFTGLFNEEAFMFAIHDKRNWNIEPCLALISMNNIQEVARKDGYLGKEKMSQRLASLMPKSSKYKAVFYVGEKSFVVVCVKEKDMLETVEYFEGLREKAKTSPWLPAGTKVVVSYMTSCGIGELSESQVETAVNKGVDFMFDNGIEETLSLDELIPFFKREKEIGKALENALENDALMVYFQPIYSVKEQCFDKAEVLVRLIDDQIGFIPPDEFISLAEQNGRIFEVEKQVIRKACKLFRQSRLAELGVKSININLSLYDLLQKELKDVLFRAMEENCLLSSNVVLEVTETANIEINRTILSNIELLHNNGMLFALDDYGTGYSNIERILTVPFEYVKVDRTVLNMSFVDEKRDIIFAKNVEMLKKCGYTIVVEGAETEEHIDKLKSLNVDYIQGYYYSKPLPINAYVEFLKEKNQIC